MLKPLNICHVLLFLWICSMTSYLLGAQFEITYYIPLSNKTRGTIWPTEFSRRINCFCSHSHLSEWPDSFSWKPFFLSVFGFPCSSPKPHLSQANDPKLQIFPLPKTQFLVVSQFLMYYIQYAHHYNRLLIKKPLLNTNHT